MSRRATCSEDNTPIQAAEVGIRVRDLFLSMMNSYTMYNDVLLTGRTIGGQDIRHVFKGGKFAPSSTLSPPNAATDTPPTGLIDISSVTQLMSSLLSAFTINEYWRKQRVFIMGGEPCNQPSGKIGRGPAKAKVCWNGREWFLYYWHTTQTGFDISATRHGWVREPPGAERLGKGDLAGLAIQDIMISSLKKWHGTGRASSRTPTKEGLSSALRLTEWTPTLNGRIGTIGQIVQDAELFDIPVSRSFLSYSFPFLSPLSPFHLMLHQTNYIVSSDPSGLEKARELIRSAISPMLSI